MADDVKDLLDKISEYRVVDLKRELEKRKLSKYGTKKELFDRLKNVSLFPLRLTVLNAQLTIFVYLNIKKRFYYLYQIIFLISKYVQIFHNMISKLVVSRCVYRHGLKINQYNYFKYIVNFTTESQVRDFRSSEHRGGIK